MNSKHRFLSLIAGIFCLALSSCESTSSQVQQTDGNYSELKKATWLMGKWQNNLPEADLYEIWIQKNDSTLAGMGFMVVGADTVFSEEINIQQNGKNLFYISKVTGENNGIPIRFKMTSAAGTAMVFENPDHDFPQKISYTRLSPDSLMAEISGTDASGKHSQQFPMARSK